MIPQEKISRPQMEEVFGFQVPIENYYLHRSHAWATLQDDGLVRVGLDDFSQKLLGQADEIRLPEIGKVYYQDPCMHGFVPAEEKGLPLRLRLTAPSRRSIPWSGKIPVSFMMTLTERAGYI